MASLIPKVLLIEDQKIARLSIKSCIAPLHWQLEMAESGQEGIQLCAQNNYDMILMDLGLPDITGIEATRIIKAIHPDLPIVALTAHFDEENKIAAFAAGMSAFIQKPFTLEKAKELSKMLYPS